VFGNYFFGEGELGYQLRFGFAKTILSFYVNAPTKNIKESQWGVPKCLDRKWGYILDETRCFPLPS
jgi:hypothetical protein